MERCFLIKYFTFALDVQLGPTEFAVTISKHSNKKAAIYNSKMANQINFDQMTLKRNVEGSVEQQWTNATKAFKLVGLFFGQWLSRPTRDFLPVLKNCYEKIKAHSESAFEVIYVGGELNQEQEQNFLKQHQPWLYVPYGTGQIQPLYNHFNVTNTPTLILLRQNMSVITSEGRNDLESLLPLQALEKWNSME
ncbi:hypothetical protein niasHS_010462 [Heterodera schachtii]|uniref:Thioredoxin-like fold domain-containing protein n=1 Tax=Heterodera schachtii TaxID=97005 RepID=A0ABD2J0B4_HETSC